MAKKEFANVFDTLSAEDILADWKWKGHPLSKEQIESLRAQARALTQSLLWKILTSEVQWLAIKTLLEKGKEANDLRAAQLLGLMVKTMDDKLKEMSK